MKSNIPSLQTETFHYLCNRGINGENIFKAPENCTSFLNKYTRFIPDTADTYIYCSLKNHFHILIKTRSDSEMRQAFFKRKGRTGSAAISLKFSPLFNGYAQGINKSYKCTGGLFETPFQKTEITDEAY